MRGKLPEIFKRVCLALAALICTHPALATEHEVAEFGSILETCYAASDDTDTKRACLGQMSQRCMDDQEGGHSTLGMTSCLNAEADVWDRFLNAEYKTTMTAFKAMDEDEAAYFPGFAKRAETLRAAQHAWIAFRDGECGLAYAMWGSGSMRNIAHADCRMTMTAERVFDLRELGAEMR